MANDKTKSLLIILITTIAVGVLMYVVPYSLDDWAWGGKVGLERLTDLFTGYNGRYLGNFLILAISRSNWLKTVIMTFVTLLIPFLCYKLINRKTIYIYLFALVLLFFMPSDMFRQTLGWASGFSNYVPPIVMSILYLDFVKNIFDDDLPKYTKLLCNVDSLCLRSF